MRKLRARHIANAAVVVLLACGVAKPAIASSGPQEAFSPSNPPAPLTARNIRDESTLYCMALAVYFEGGSSAESEEGQRHIARVIHQRAQANLPKWGGSDICDVVFHKRAGVCQFSFACLPKGQRTPLKGAAWRYSMRVANDELEGSSNVEDRSARYYMNPALTSDRNACRFRREFVPVLNAGRHEFFREPRREERAALEQATPIECMRHADAIKAKRRAEAAAKKKLAQKRLAQKKRVGRLGKRMLSPKGGKRQKLKYAGK